MSEKRMKPKTMWAISNVHDRTTWIVAGSVFYYRYQAVSYAEKQGRRSWAQLQEAGYRAVKVVVTEAQP